MSTPDNCLFTVDIYDYPVAIRYPAAIADRLGQFFDLNQRKSSRYKLHYLDLIENGDATFRLEYEAEILWDGLTWPNLLPILCQEIETLIATRTIDACVRAGAVGHDGKGIMILGPAGSGKSELTAWLASRQFAYQADNFVSLATDYSNIHDARDVMSPLALPMILHRNPAMETLFGNRLLSAGDRMIADFPSRNSANSPDHLPENCGLIIIPKRSPEVNTPARIEIVPSLEANFQLQQAIHPAQRGYGPNAVRVEKFARSVPAIIVEFSDFSQLDGVLDRYIRMLFAHDVTPTTFRSFHDDWCNGRLPNVPQPATTSASVTAPSIITHPPRRLTIGMATYDDFDGVYFTLQALRMYHPETVDDVEYIIIDNNPDGPCGPPIKQLQSKAPNLRYIPVKDRSGTAVRDYIMSEAASDHVLSLDCHVLLEPGVVARLMRYFSDHPNCNDLLQGPIVWDELNRVATHMEPSWRAGFLGTWAEDPRGLEPDQPAFEIPMHGLGLYACRRAAWPGYNKEFSGFGGEEGYIHEKFRQAGGRTLCLPFLRWLHRFPRPLGVPYRNSWEDRVRNYLIGATELGMPTEEVIEHFRQHLGATGNMLIERAQKEVADLIARNRL